MRKHILFCSWVTVGLFAVVFQAFAQPPDSLWSRIYGGTGDNEQCYAMQQTSDGGYMLAGRTNSFGAGGTDFWLVKTNENGDSLWSHTYGGSDNESVYAAQQTFDGGYMLAGYTKSFGGSDQDFWLVKTDEDGDSLWSHIYGGGSDDFCWSVVQTFDSGYALAGLTNSYEIPGHLRDFWLLKTDADGDSLWSNTYGTTAYHAECHCVQQTSDTGYILAGSIEYFSEGNKNFWLVKTNSTGTQQWEKSFGGSSDEVCNTVRQTPDGGYILGGYTESYSAGDKDIWLLKTNSSGTKTWDTTYGGAGEDRCSNILLTPDGGYLLAGLTTSFGSGQRDFWIVKTDSLGDSLWSRTFGGSDDDMSNTVHQTSDGAYIIGGHTRSFGSGGLDFWLVKTGGIYPTITSITDVGNDQGRQARIRWHRSNYDGCSPDYTITDYNIYRRIDQYLFTDDGKTRHSGLDWPPGEWEFITTVPARYEEEYATIAPTLADSTSEDIYWSVFFISAETPDPGIYFDSEPDSGYSVDNLPPDVTLMTAMVPTSPNTIKLQWQEVTTGGGGQLEQGGVWYRVYGSTDPMFTPAPENLLTTTQNLEFDHNIGANDKYFYIIQASDDH